MLYYLASLRRLGLIREEQSHEETDHGIEVVFEDRTPLEVGLLTMTYFDECRRLSEVDRLETLEVEPVSICDMQPVSQVLSQM